MREASAFAPGHLTGFFQICDEADDLLLKGSRGAGASITLGVHTRVRVEPSDQNKHTISFNGKVTDGFFVSENVLGRMLGRTERRYRVCIDHRLETPLGAGFGSSGGGALTLALALNECLGLGMSYIEAAGVAHVAEIECKTGLGTVFAATEGGFGVLFKPGAPGIGEALKYSHSEDLAIVFLHFGPLSTKEALTNPALRGRINELGGRFVDELSRNLKPATFMELSQRFNDHLGIATPRLKAVLDDARKARIPCTMAMFGEVAFSLVERDKAEEVAEFLRGAAPGREVQIARIEDRGARLT